MVLAFALALAAPPVLPPAPGENEAAAPATLPDAPIRWSAPADCPDSTVVVERTSELLGRPLRPGELDMDGVIEPTERGYALVLSTGTEDSRQTQRLESERCEVLVETAALIAAVLVDPIAAVATVDRGPPPPAEPEPGPTPTPPVQPLPATAPLPPTTPPPSSSAPEPPPRKRGVLGWARLRGGGEYGAVPGGTGGFDGSLALGTERLRGELIGAYWVGREVRRGGGVATVSLGHATPRFCGLVLPGKVQLPLCAGLELGAMRADARSVPAAETRRGLWLAAHAAAGVRWSFRPRVSLWVEAQLFVPLVFPSFELVDPNDASLTSEVYSPSPAGGRGLIGIEYKLF